MAPATATLERKKFSAQEVAVLNNRSLLEDAKQLLQYTPDALRQESTRLARYTNEYTVAQVLDRLEVEPLDTKNVEAYKNQKIQEAFKRQSSKFVRYMHRGHDYDSRIGRGERVVWITTTILVLSAIVTAVTVGASTHPLPLNVVNGFRMYWGFAASIYCILMYARHKNAITVSATWKDHGIGTYTSRIPEFALARAVSIKKELPEAEFRVEQLEVEEHGVDVQKHDPDPFMVMHYKTVKLYLDVWDEPKFEGVRQV